MSDPFRAELASFKAVVESGRQVKSAEREVALARRELDEAIAAAAEVVSVREVSRVTGISRQSVYAALRRARTT